MTDNRLIERWRVQRMKSQILWDWDVWMFGFVCGFAVFALLLVNTTERNARATADPIAKSCE